MLKWLSIPENTVGPVNHTNAQGENNVPLSPHPIYLDLGRTEDERHAAYRELFCSHLEPGIIDTIRKATNGNFVLGNNRFQDEISQAFGAKSETWCGRQTTVTKSVNH